MRTLRTAFITGASRNLGREFALQLADAGHAVAINGRDPERLEAVVKEVQQRGGKAVACPGDVTNDGEITAALGKAESELGPIDILINNAVIRAHGAVEETGDELWHEVLNVVIMGSVHCIRYVVPGMKERGWGRIINMAGVSGQQGGVDRAAIVTAKSGLIGLTKAVARETAKHGITVNAISPGLIGTDERVVGIGAAEVGRGQTANIPVGRMGRQDEVASAVVYLASEKSSFMTGQVIAINGGLYM